jgi:hypothetical protein
MPMALKSLFLSPVSTGSPHESEHPKIHPPFTFRLAMHQLYDAKNKHGIRTN